MNRRTSLTIQILKESKELDEYIKEMQAEKVKFCKVDLQLNNVVFFENYDNRLFAIADIKVIRNLNGCYVEKSFSPEAQGIVSADGTKILTQVSIDELEKINYKEILTGESLCKKIATYYQPIIEE